MDVLCKWMCYVNGCELKTDEWCKWMCDVNGWGRGRREEEGGARDAYKRRTHTSESGRKYGLLNSFIFPHPSVLGSLDFNKNLERTNLNQPEHIQTDMTGDMTDKWQKKCQIYLTEDMTETVTEAIYCKKERDKYRTRRIKKAGKKIKERDEREQSTSI